MGRRDEARWWLRTAEGDLEAARLLSKEGNHNLCAFHAQQAAEKALKAILVRRGLTRRTHACTELLAALQEAGADPPRGLGNAARRLDLHYVQSRYPNGLGGDPTEFYDAEIAGECLDLAGDFLDYARSSPEERG